MLGAKSSKAFEKQKSELLSSKRFAQSSVANKDQAANAFLPLYPIFKDLSVHHVLSDDLRASINSSPKDFKACLETRIKLLLIRLCTCVWVTDLEESMVALKKLVQDSNTGSQAM